jgi:pimeloyl-ACP methyl ester carboxylesterase
MECHQIRILTDVVCLDGQLETPDRPRGIVLFAHGSGSSRRSPRNVHVAAILQHSGFATLLFDLLTEHEAADRRHVFDVPVLARRLRCAAEAVRAMAPASALPMGYFGASTGAAAALVAAATDPRISAVVSRGGRPDLAWDALPHVAAPTLLIVGELDHDVLRMNRHAYARLGGTKQLTIVPGATHLFEEPGTLDVAARLAIDWFTAHLSVES